MKKKKNEKQKNNESIFVKVPRHQNSHTPKERKRQIYEKYKMMTK